MAWEKGQETRKENAEKTRQRNINNPGEALWYRYHITLEQFETLMEYQGGVCAICRKPPSGRNKKLSIDHDHACCDGHKSCGKCIRGLLCSRCNAVLGFLDDSADLFTAISLYLGQPPSKNALGLWPSDGKYSKGVEEIADFLLKRWCPHLCLENTPLPTPEETSE